MWKKMFRSRSSLSYRKKYKCPECNNYSLYIIHDEACECMNDCCCNDNIDIFKTMKENDFCGYYTSQELKDSFYINDEECNKIFKNITINNTLNLLSVNEKQKVESFFETTSKIDERLDDIVVDYLNFSNLKETQKLTPFGYIINMIEDIHFYINLCCKDIVLFNYGVEYASRNFYSGRFFYNNAVEHLFQANERSYVLLGILYGFNFNTDLSTNKTYKIEKFLKKDVNYKNSQFKSIFEKLKSNNFYKELRDIRDYNTHDLSYLTKVIKDDIEKSGNKNLEFWNRDGNEVDIDLYLPKIKGIIFCLNEFYNLLDMVLQHLKGNKCIYNINGFPMINKYLNFNDNIAFNIYETKDFEELHKHNMELFQRLPDYKSQLIVDIVFRMNEVIHCVADIYNISGENFYSFWRSNGIDLYGLIDIQYLLYSALLRLYSCYDKLARYISNIDSKCSEIEYFENFANIVENGRIINKIRKILDDDNYKLLFQLRNDIYHNLRAGCLYGEKGFEYYNLVLFQIVFENVIIITDFINFINPKNKIKAGRNDPCPCGSGVKFKKCCGTT